MRMFLFKWRTQNWKMKGRETSTPRTSRGFLTRIVKAHLKLFIPLNAHSRKSRRNLQALGNVLMSEDYVVEDYVVVVDCPSEIQGKATPGSSRVDIITCRHPVRQQKGHLENRWDFSWNWETNSPKLERLDLWKGAARSCSYMDPGSSNKKRIPLV